MKPLNVKLVRLQSRLTCLFIKKQSQNDFVFCEDGCCGSFSSQFLFVGVIGFLCGLFFGLVWDGWRWILVCAGMWLYVGWDGMRVG
jgi:hypothetical protein